MGIWVGVGIGIWARGMDRGGDRDMGRDRGRDRDMGRGRDRDMGKGMDRGGDRDRGRDRGRDAQKGSRKWPPLPPVILRKRIKTNRGSS